MMDLKDKVWRRLPLLVVPVLLIGCSNNGQYPVHGRVTYEDGSPLTEGIVVGEMSEGESRVMARGNVESDGSFSWGTKKPGDGAKPGKYRVVVLARTVGEREASQGKLPDVDPKFSNPKTSGIDFEVQPGKNELNIKVSKPQPKTAQAAR